MKTALNLSVERQYVRGMSPPPPPPPYEKIAYARRKCLFCPLRGTKKGVVQAFSTPKTGLRCEYILQWVQCLWEFPILWWAPFLCVNRLLSGGVIALCLSFSQNCRIWRYTRGCWRRVSARGTKLWPAWPARMRRLAFQSQPDFAGPTDGAATLEICSNSHRTSRIKEGPTSNPGCQKDPGNGTPVTAIITRWRSSHTTTCWVSWVSCLSAYSDACRKSSRFRFIIPMLHDLLSESGLMLVGLFGRLLEVLLALSFYNPDASRLAEWVGSHACRLIRTPVGSSPVSYNNPDTSRLWLSRFWVSWRDLSINPVLTSHFFTFQVRKMERKSPKDTKRAFVWRTQNAIMAWTKRTPAKHGATKASPQTVMTSTVRR